MISAILLKVIVLCVVFYGMTTLIAFERTRDFPTSVKAAATNIPTALVMIMFVVILAVYP